LGGDRFRKARGKLVTGGGGPQLEDRKVKKEKEPVEKGIGKIARNGSKIGKARRCP